MRRLGSKFTLDPQLTFETITATTRYVIRLPGVGFYIELFSLSDDPYDRQRFARRERCVLWGRNTFLPTAEDVIVTKLLWALRANRDKDTGDVRNVIAVRADRLDWPYIHQWCDRHGTRELLDRIRSSLPPN